MALIDLIREEVVRVPLAAQNKEGIIRELVEVLAAAGTVSDPAAAARAVLDREAKGSTGLEEGVAVPHGKTAAVESLAIAVGIAPRGVDFAALDGKPSNLFFLILAPPDQSGPHIEALAEIARLCRSKAFCRTLASSRDAKEAVGLFQD
ncbi:MAG: fructose PTS transporter subunit IIA [Candidatus Moduliflexus flocculans]|nr:fructose PTS transporter subunit IIA [Candidatus Moduliflexus flocculans]